MDDNHSFFEVVVNCKILLAQDGLLTFWMLDLEVSTYAQDVELEPLNLFRAVVMVVGNR